MVVGDDIMMVRDQLIVNINTEPVRNKPYQLNQPTVRELYSLHRLYTSSLEFQLPLKSP